MAVVLCNLQLRPIYFGAVNASLQSIVNVAKPNVTQATVKTETVPEQKLVEIINPKDYEILAKNNTAEINLTRIRDLIN